MVLGELIYQRMDRVIGQRVLSVKEEERPFFGPLTIHPEFWAKGIAKRLLESTMQLFSKWNTQHAGLFTFAQSSKHIALYQK